jgi:hypothetical protein
VLDVAHDVSARLEHDFAATRRPAVGLLTFRSLAMTYRDIPIEAKPEGLRDPHGRVIPIKSLQRNFAVLTEMTYDEFAPLGAKRRSVLKCAAPVTQIIIKFLPNRNEVSVVPMPPAGFDACRGEYIAVDPSRV